MPHLPQPARARSMAFSRVVRRKAKAAPADEVIPVTKAVAADTASVETLLAAAPPEA